MQERNLENLALLFVVQSLCKRMGCSRCRCCSVTGVRYVAEVRVGLSQPVKLQLQNSMVNVIFSFCFI